MSGPDRIDEVTKIEMYAAGAYSVPTPPVCTDDWDRAAWIRWIEQHGRWHVEEMREHPEPAEPVDPSLGHDL